MRRDCMGAVLLDLDDPSPAIGRLREPLLAPGENGRQGYRIVRPRSTTRSATPGTGKTINPTPITTTLEPSAATAAFRPA
jgi:hypothetical protein